MLLFGHDFQGSSPPLQYLIDPNAPVAQSPAGGGGARGRGRGAGPSSAAAAAPKVLSKEQMERSVDRMFDGEWAGDALIFACMSGYGLRQG